MIFYGIHRPRPRYRKGYVHANIILFLRVFFAVAQGHSCEYDMIFDVI